MRRARQIGRLDATRNFVRTRLMPASKCVPGTFRTIESGTASVVICRVKGAHGNTRAQSILRPKLRTRR